MERSEVWVEFVKAMIEAGVVSDLGEACSEADRLLAQYDDRFPAFNYSIPMETGRIGRA